MSDDRLKIAVFIDFDNIEIGVKTTLGGYFDIGAVLESIKERGEIVTKVAYGDWARASDYGRAMSQHAVHMVQRNLTPGGDKNGADINLALDALEMAFTHNHINSFVIVSGDSDFISLVEKLKQYDRKVFVLGGRAFTSAVMQKNCTEFIAYENIVGRGGRTADRARSAGDGSLAQAMPLVRRALKLLADREVLPQLGLLKSTLLQLDSAFSEREYGAGSFRDFVQKLAKAGYVTLKGSERSFHVELRESGETGAHHATPAAHHAAAPAAHPAPPPLPAPATGHDADAPEAEASAGDGLADSAADSRPGPAAALEVIRQGLARAASPRWPLYIRQVKQFVRAFDSQFDERRYGFGSLVEALKYCQREGLLRLERDRQGIVRVWPGVNFQKPGDGGTAPVPPGDIDFAETADVVASPPVDGAELDEPMEVAAAAVPAAGDPPPDSEPQADQMQAVEAAEGAAPGRGRRRGAATKPAGRQRRPAGARKTASGPARATRGRKAPKSESQG